MDGWTRENDDMKVIRSVVKKKGRKKIYKSFFCFFLNTAFFCFGRLVDLSFK